MTDNLNDIMNTPPEKRKTGMPKWLIIWIVVASVALLGIGNYAYRFFSSKPVMDALNAGKLPYATTTDWTKATYGVYGLSVETPKKVLPGSLNLPDDVKKYIDRMDIFQSDSANGLNIQIVSAKYAAIVGQGNLQGAANGAAAKMQAIDGVSDFISSDEHVITKDSIPGIIQSGKYKYGGATDFEFIDAMYLKGLLYWQVVVVYMSKDDASRQIAKRVVNSIEIEIPQ
ncbi:MAG TPA: hypothetical protein VK806_14470 [Bacteroidia bacterium]|jgi:hypothetical protein|nr:hypothetical protein [Bacteroidia bacterium]